MEGHERLGEPVIRLKVNRGQEIMTGLKMILPQSEMIEKATNSMQNDKDMEMIPQL